MAHKKLDGSEDFSCVGSYPDGTEPDMKYGNPGERPDSDERINKLGLPLADPVFGSEGHVMTHWK